MKAVLHFWQQENVKSHDNRTFLSGLSDVSSRLYSLSDITNRLHDCDFTYDIPLQYRIKRLSHEELGQLYAELRQHPEQKISLFPYFNSPHNSISKNLLLALIAFKLSDLKNAYRHMSLFIEENAQRNIKTERYSGISHTRLFPL